MERAGAAEQELDGHPLTEVAVGALGEPDRTHAAAADLGEQPVAAVAAQLGAAGRGRRREQGRGRAVEQAGGAGGIGREQLADVTQQLRVLGREACQRIGAGLGRKLGDLEEELGRPAMTSRGKALRGRGPVGIGRGAALRERLNRDGS